MNNDFEMYVINFSRVNSNSNLSDNSHEDICSICYLEKEEDKYEFWECNHKFHLDCAKEWIIRKITRPTCPLCRNNKLNNNYENMIVPELEINNSNYSRKKLFICFLFYIIATIFLYTILICSEENIKKFNDCPFIKE